MVFSHNVSLQFHIVSRTYIGYACDNMGRKKGNKRVLRDMSESQCLTNIKAVFFNSHLVLYLWVQAPQSVNVHMCSTY